MISLSIEIQRSKGRKQASMQTSTQTRLIAAPQTQWTRGAVLTAAALTAAAALWTM
jgi:hypothetical protein